MWQNWNTNALLVELWIDPTILEDNSELCLKNFKWLPALWSSHTIAGFVRQRDHKEKDLYKNIFTWAPCYWQKNWKTRVCPSIEEWVNKLWYILVMEYYCSQRNNELEEFHVNWNDLQELMQSKRSRTRKTLYTETDTLWHNPLEKYMLDHVVL